MKRNGGLCKNGGLSKNETNRSNNNEIKIHIKKMTLLEVSAFKGPT